MTLPCQLKLHETSIKHHRPRSPSFAADISAHLVTQRLFRAGAGRTAAVSSEAFLGRKLQQGLENADLSVPRIELLTCTISI